jgi:hypothetical protein
VYGTETIDEGVKLYLMCKGVADKDGAQPGKSISGIEVLPVHVVGKSADLKAVDDAIGAPVKKGKLDFAQASQNLRSKIAWPVKISELHYLSIALLEDRSKSTSF